VNPRFDTRDASDTLFRLGRKPDVWGWTDWAYAGDDGRFNNRWDDSLGTYRVLYTSCSRLGAYLEVLAEYRPDLNVLAEISEIDQNDAGAPPTSAPGSLPPRWRAERILQQGISSGVRKPLVDVGGTTSLATLRRELAAEALRLGIREVDAATIRERATRRFTQRVSSFIYEQPELYAGIFYLSRFGNDAAHCAIFERSDDSDFPVVHLDRSEIELNDEDFLEACRLHGIQPS